MPGPATQTQVWDIQKQFKELLCWERVGEVLCVPTLARALIGALSGALSKPSSSYPQCSCWDSLGEKVRGSRDSSEF